MKLEANASSSNNVKDKSKLKTSVDTKAQAVTAKLSNSKQRTLSSNAASVKRQPLAFGVTRQASSNTLQSSKKEFEARQAKTPQGQATRNKPTDSPERSNSRSLSNHKQSGFRSTPVGKKQQQFVFWQAGGAPKRVKKEGVAALPMNSKGDSEDTEPVDRWDLVENDGGRKRKHKHKKAKFPQKNHKGFKTGDKKDNKDKKGSKDKKRKSLLDCFEEPSS